MSSRAHVRPVSLLASLVAWPLLVIFGGVSLLACGGAAEPAKAPAEAASPEAASGVAAVDRSGLPEPGPTLVWAPPAPASWNLAGGASVLHQSHGSVPLVSLILIIPRGAETDPPKQAGLTSFMADLIDEGAGKLDALQLNEQLQLLATDFGANAAMDATYLVMNMIAENFGPSVDLLADIVRRPRFDEHEFQRKKAQLIAQSLASEADPHTGRRVALSRALFGEGYAGLLPNGTRDSLAGISLANIKSHYSRLMVGEGATFVVVGGIAREQVAEHLERAFGDWAGKAKTEVRPVAADSGAGKLYFVDYPGAAQSVVTVARRVPGADAEDLFPATVFNRSFGESFTSRVNLNLREDKGYTYGALSTFQRYRKAGVFSVSSDVRTDVTRASLDEVLRELGDVCGSRPLTAEERDNSVNGLLLGYPGTFESIGLVALRFAQLRSLDRPLDWYQHWPERVSSVTLDQANAVGHRYCDRAAFTLVVAGDKAKVAPTLEGMGYGWVELDARGRPR
jgi:zinc protease